MSSQSVPKVVPAQLSFLAIYNPSLSNSDETFRDQIVFYYSKAARTRSKHGAKDPAVERELREQENEKLRQVGLAQGMVNFARSFSNGQALDNIETHKARIITHELETGWWILASIDLTQLPSPSTQPGNSKTSTPAVEYSSREVSPPSLLLQQLIAAHSVFLLHHVATLQDLFARLERVKFCDALDRYWAKFAANWDVLLHGSPAVEIFGGLKLAAGGELGIGVGEEEWGSGEREVLEDYARRTDGLVDVIVSRFGEPSPLQDSKQKTSPGGKHSTQSPSDLEPWLGSGRYAGAVDGIVFSGVGALSRKSLRDLSRWIESIYSYGDYAYGVREDPNSSRRKRRKRNPEVSESKAAVSTTTKVKMPASAPASPRRHTTVSPSRSEPEFVPRIPPPIVTSVESSLNKASSRVDAKRSQVRGGEEANISLTDAETWVKYLTLGYGSAWGGKGGQRPEPVVRTRKQGDFKDDGSRSQSQDVSLRYVEPEPDVDNGEERRLAQIQQENTGYFIIGLKGDVDDEEADDGTDETDGNSKIMVRTVLVELTNAISVDGDAQGDQVVPDQDKSSEKTLGGRKLARLRPVVYVHRPFIYTFLFKPQTESLTLASFYRNLHTYFSPLHRPLSNSTAPDRVAARIAGASNPYTTISALAGAEPDALPIYDLVYDPRTLTVHSSIPNIPEPGTLTAEGLGGSGSGADWSRVEALNVHSQIVATVSGTRGNMSEIERTCKTSRGWWVVWMRLAPSQAEGTGDSVLRGAEGDEADEGDCSAPELREAFLIRRARDGAGAGSKHSGSSMGARIGGGMWRLGVPSTEQKMGGAGAGWGPRGLTEGIGIDARRYIEGLLSLNR